VRPCACSTPHIILTKKRYFSPLGTTLTNFLRIYKHSPTIKNKQPTAATIRYHNLEPVIIKNITNFYIKLSPKISTSPTGSANHLSPLQFQTFNEKYFEIGMELNDFSIQLVKYCKIDICSIGETDMDTDYKRL